MLTNFSKILNSGASILNILGGRQMKPESGQFCSSATLLVLSCIVFVLAPALFADTIALPDADNVANLSFENHSGKAENSCILGA
jgi:hypothetical protein